MTDLLLGVFDSPLAQSSMLTPLGLRPDLLREGMDRMDEEALQAVGIDSDLIEVDPPGSSPRQRRRHIPFTGAAKEVLENALREAIALDHRHIGAEHIVLGLTGLPPQDRVSRLLDLLDVEPAQVRATVLAAMRRAS